MATMLEQGQKLARGEEIPPPIAQLLGFALKAIELGRAIFEMHVDERYHNPMGTLHGGIFCDLADAAMGYAYASTLGEGESFTTVELKINFFRPGTRREAHGGGTSREIRKQAWLRRVRRHRFQRQAGGTGGKHLHEITTIKQVNRGATLGCVIMTYEGKHLPKATSRRGEPLIRILRRHKAHKRLRSLARKPSHVSLSAVTRRSASPW